VPLKILATASSPRTEYVLEPGDMLYLPPRYAHDGIADGECQTYSIGFRAPAPAELARELLQRMADEAAEDAGEALYRRSGAARRPPTGAHSRGRLRAVRPDALQPRLKRPAGASTARWASTLTEPKANVWFESGGRAPRRCSALLDRRTRMLHDDRHVFVNGESWRAGGRMRR
jgi:50S ribosomal protein L16 3-hydroxylase